MTNPFDSNDPYGNLPQYGPTNHPEDNPGFGQQGAPGNAGYGAPGYAGYGTQPLYGGAGNGTVPTDGKVHVFDAIGWAFRTTFKNWQMWILGGLVYLAIIGTCSVLESATGMASLSLLSGIVGLVLGPLTARLVLRQLDGTDAAWGDVGKDVNWGPALAVVVVWSLVIGLVMALVGVLVFFLIGGADASFSAESLEALTNDEAMAFVGSLMGVLAIVTILSLLITPFVFSLTWLPVDRRSGFADTFPKSFKLGAANYFPLLGFYILLGVIVMVGVILTLGLGAIVAVPVSMLATGHVYRQMVGGPVPASGER